MNVFILCCQPLVVNDPFILGRLVSGFGVLNNLVDPGSDFFLLSLLDWLLNNHCFIIVVFVKFFLYLFILSFLGLKDIVAHHVLHRQPTCLAVGVCLRGATSVRIVTIKAVPS